MPDFSVIIKSPVIKKIVQEQIVKRALRDAVLPPLLFSDDEQRRREHFGDMRMFSWVTGFVLTAVIAVGVLGWGHLTWSSLGMIAIPVYTSTVIGIASLLERRRRVKDAVRRLGG